MRITNGRFLLERLAGLLILPIVPLMVAAVVLDPGLETRPEYLGESFARFAPHREAYLASTILMLAAAFAILAAGAALLLRFRLREMNLATASGLGLLASGLLVLAAGVASLRIYQLSTEWLALSGTVANQVESFALGVQQLRFAFALLGFPLLLTSLICCGVVFHRLTGLPRWLLRLPVISGIIMAASPLGFLGPGFVLFLGISALVLFAWLTLEIFLLLTRETATSAVNTGQPTS